MTISYTAEVATCRNYGPFIKLLARWKGSIYKLIWRDLIAFLCLYYALSFLYAFGLDTHGQKLFQNIVHYCNMVGEITPMSLILGFYVSLVSERWWEQYMAIPWPDTIAVYVSVYIQGTNERERIMRRTIMRYVCLCQVMAYLWMVNSVKKRFPTLSHLVNAGLLLESEKAIIESFQTHFPSYPLHWMPIVWAASIVTRARREGIINEELAVKTIIDSLNSFRGYCGFLLYYDWVNVPLIYTQTVTIMVYAFFFVSLMGAQHMWREGFLGFPVYPLLQYFFYMGWLKVAETMINPFGDDDDDFEVNWMLDRNLQVSYTIVDEMYDDHPKLVKDQYWDEVFPTELPYANEVDVEEPPEPSTVKFDVPKSIADLTNVNVDRKSSTYLSGSIPFGYSSSSHKYDKMARVSFAVLKYESSSESDIQRDKKQAQEGEIEEEKFVKRESLIETPEESLTKLYTQNADVDEFERLKAERENDRFTRLRQRMAIAAQLAQGDENENPEFEDETPNVDMADESNENVNAVNQDDTTDANNTNVPSDLTNALSASTETLKAASSTSDKRSDKTDKDDKSVDSEYESALSDNFSQQTIDGETDYASAISRSTETLQTTETTNNDTTQSNNKDSAGDKKPKDKDKERDPKS